MKRIIEPLTFEKFVKESEKYSSDDILIDKAFDYYMTAFDIFYKNKRHLIFDKAWNYALKK